MNSPAYYLKLSAHAQERHALLVRRIAARLAVSLNGKSETEQGNLVSEATAEIVASRNQVSRDLAHIGRIRARDAIQAPDVLALEPINARPDSRAAQEHFQRNRDAAEYRRARSFERMGF